MKKKNAFVAILSDQLNSIYHQTFMLKSNFNYKIPNHFYAYTYLCICLYIKNTHNLFKVTNISLPFRSFINMKQNYKQKIQITQQYNKSKLHYEFYIINKEKILQQLYNLLEDAYRTFYHVVFLEVSKSYGIIPNGLKIKKAACI